MSNKILLNCERLSLTLKIAKVLNVTCLFLTAFRKKSPILKECEGANSTNEWVGDEFRLALAKVIFLSLFAIIRE